MKFKIIYEHKGEKAVTKLEAKTKIKAKNKFATRYPDSKLIEIKPVI